LAIDVASSGIKIFFIVEKRPSEREGDKHEKPGVCEEHRRVSD
jgi:hypothetical protein